MQKAVLTIRVVKHLSNCAWRIRITSHGPVVQCRLFRVLFLYCSPVQPRFFQPLLFFGRSVINRCRFTIRQQPQGLSQPGRAFVCSVARGQPQVRHAEGRLRDYQTHAEVWHAERGESRIWLRTCAEKPLMMVLRYFSRFLFTLFL